MNDYKKRLVEVDEILNYLSEEDLMKIPKEIRKVIRDNKDLNYCWKYDESKELKDQDVSRDTIAFLTYLNMKYLLNEEQKKLMEQILKFNEDKAEREKREKYEKYYNKDLFKVEKEVKSTIEEILGETQMITFKEKFFTKILNRIKSFFV